MLRAARHPDGHPVYTPPVGFAPTVFFAIGSQRMNTLAVVKRETLDWTRS